MKGSTMFLARKIFAGFALICSGVLAACAPTTSSTAPRAVAQQVVAIGNVLPSFPAPPPGAYTYSTLAGDLTETRSAENPLVRQQSNGAVAVVDSCGRALSRSGSGPTVTFTPDNGQLPCDDLSVGRRWTRTYQTTFGASVQNRQRDCQVVRHEQLTIPAGTFAAARVECTNQLIGGGFVQNIEVVHYRVSDRLTLQIEQSAPNPIRNVLVRAPSASGG